MRILSPTEAISPAIERTKLVLFTPFRLGRSWKIGITGYLGYSSVLYIPIPLVWLIGLLWMGHTIPNAPAWLVPVGCAAIAILLLLFTWVFHLCTRLSFCFFDVVLNKGEFVGPAWHKYGPGSRRWTLVKIAYGTAVTLLMAAPIVAYVRHMIQVVEAMPAMPQGSPSSPEAMAQMFRLEAAFFSGYFLIFGTFAIAALLGSVATDFVVPSLALENTTVKEALRRFWMLAKHEPGQLAGYTGMKLLMAFCGYMAAVFGAELIFLLGGGIIALLVVAIGFGLHALGVPVAVLIGLGVLIGVALYLALMWLVSLAMGVVLTFLQAYLLFFLGGRYGLVGEALERSTPPLPQGVYPNWPPQFRQAQPYPGAMGGPPAV